MNNPTSTRAVVNVRAAGGLHGGVPRYITEVTRRLPDLPRINPPRSMVRGVAGHAWEQTILPLRLRRGQTLWSPANFGPLAVRNQVLSIYDLSPIDHPEWFGDRYARLFTWMVPRLAGRVAHVITISEFSRQRIIDELGVSDASITIAPPGVSTVFEPGVPGERTGDIVVVAGPDPRKNLDRVLAAWKQVRSSLPDARLVVITGRRSDGVFGPTPDVSAERVVAVADPSDAELTHRYRTAAAVVSVPLYEGFGLPAAEALACGTPLIVSDIPAHDHARAHAGAVVDPTDVTAIADALRSIGSMTVGVPEGWTRPSWDTTADIVGRVLGASQPTVDIDSAR